MPLTNSTLIEVPNVDSLGTVNQPTTGNILVEEAGMGYPRVTTLTLDNVQVAITDSGANGGHGSHKVYDLPAGVVGCIAVTNLTVTVVSGGIAANTTVISAVGSTATATDNATLTSTEANFAASASVTLASSTGTVASVGSAITILDGTSTPVDVYLNFGGDATGVTANGVIAVSGTVRLTWFNFGDK